MRKPTFCICENKDADQLRGYREADQRLCFRYMASTTPLLSKSEISILQPSCVAVQPGLCRTWSETPKTGFLTTRLKYLDTLKCCCNHPKTRIKSCFFFTVFLPMIHEPRCEKTGLRDFRPGPTQTRLYNHTRWLEA